ncbi:unnamed protein product [Cylindrotheca closterium]|uniref:Uncharacterized protein n=1 Tax=Cylindrotheca closterium TaxID=2856 RepID=A0AAD2FVQ9_9STRA|nr:unnamed protein product [Cylindrotheca closterium]
MSEGVIPPQEPQIIIDTDDDSALTQDQQDERRMSVSELSLPFLLKGLFGLNGLTLALQSLSLMYIVNTQVAMPVSLLPSYGAIAFLPCSLKSIYGYLSQYGERMHLFVVLLMANSLCLVCTALIPEGGVFLAFLWGFLRGITDSWAEFILGLSLVDHAVKHGTDDPKTFDLLSSQFQAEASTMRNLGTMLSSIFACALFLARQLYSPEQEQLSGSVAKGLLYATALFQLTGALVACSFWQNMANHLPTPNDDSGFHRINQVDDSFRQMEETTTDEASALMDEEGSFPSYTSESTDGEFHDDDEVEAIPRSSIFNWVLVALLQTIILCMGLKDPIIEHTSHLIWAFFVSAIFLLIVMMSIAMYSQSLWKSSHRVGLFLVLRHAIPSDGMVLGAFYYGVFQSAPLLLQLLSLVNRVVSTLSSWSYGKFFSKYSSGNNFLAVIAGTTLLAAVANLTNLFVFENVTSAHIFWVVLAVQAVTTFCKNWSFLPDVVLATKSLSGTVCAMDSSEPRLESRGRQDKKRSMRIGVEYGTLVSCIDFGDQIGAVAAGPMVAALGVSRENDWRNLGSFIVFSGMFTVASIGLIKLIHKRVP